MGKPRTRIREFREQGEDHIADWIERKEKARREGVTLWKWLKDNPKPKTTSELQIEENNKDNPLTETEINEAARLKAPKSYYNPQIPVPEQVLLDRMRSDKKKLKAKARKLKNSPKELKTVYQVLKRLDNEERKLIYKYDFDRFDEDMCKELQDRVVTAPFHFEMFGMYQSYKRCCVICPRNHAKSTTARKYILHQILYLKTTYTIILGSSEDMAGQNLRWIRDQFVDNSDLVAVYGYLKNKDKWADTEFQTNTGVKVSAKGAGQKIRGANEKGRPDLIYIDDIEEDEGVKSKDRRDKLDLWFRNAVLPALSRNGQVIITGTILHYDSLLRNVSRNKVSDHIPWQVLEYKAISLDEDGNEKALWPEHKPLDVLRKLRNVDPVTFAQEYQNDPSSGGLAVFNRSEYMYISEDDIKKDPVDQKIYVKNMLVNVLITTDFAISEKDGADYTVFMASGMDQFSNLYVLDYVRWRTSDPFEQMEVLFDFVKKWYAEICTFEIVAFQKTFQKFIERKMADENFFFFIQEMTRKSMAKIFRIKALKAPIRAQKIYWSHEHTELEEELEHITVTSLGVKDDVVDCLSDAWEIQVEMWEDSEKSGPAVNSLEWAIQKGFCPLAAENEERVTMDELYELSDFL